ncbi:transglutaminase-like cysteine peptidase [Echinimonas agarilytica]|uniref:Transglutaminase-like cysteine peptidase n=1 Tax=Echinimonas agarilytica TaxID=1215918 RepID=A0AA41W7D1_9GAMM|nr:transglutaminase-like cysteine peptidase [Echinimonas agarilytica]MCM2680329.1 transglutaminase-like cysteine peptidase [Echinimonas agarilytica]
MPRAFSILILTWLSLCLAVGVYSANQELDFSKIIQTLNSKYGQDAATRGASWQKLIQKNLSSYEVVQLKAVNDYFNGFLFAEDSVVWKKNDYWATPVEFIGRGAGDCEDFTIAKYFTLLEMGFPQEKLRLMYVKAVRYNQHHMVLTYYHKRGAVPLVLDNIDPEIKPATERGDLIPIYSFDADYLWLAKARGEGQLVGGSERLSLWKDLRQRLSEFVKQGADLTVSADKETP